MKFPRLPVFSGFRLTEESGRYNDEMQRKRAVLILCTVLVIPLVLLLAQGESQNDPRENREQRASSAQRQDRQRERPARLPVRGTRGAIAVGSEPAAEAGMRILHAGGNAVDAGVAALFAAAVTEFSHFGMGGEAPILIRTANGRVVSLPGVGTMPAEATPGFFRTRRLMVGEIMAIEPRGLKGIVPVAGLMPALVPGMVDAGLVALQQFGTLPFSKVIEPAIGYADGFALDETRAGSIARSRRFFDLWPASRAVFLPGGSVPRPGDIFRQPELAKTLRLMAGAEQRALEENRGRTGSIEAVRDLFYRGEIAKKIAEFSRANGGLLSYEDMAKFRVQPEEPVAMDYAGTKVFKPGFWTQGPVMLQALAILEQMNLQALGYASPEYLHSLVEALKLAYADRDTYYGDPAFVRVPAQELLSKHYASERRREITDRASTTFRPGAIEGFPPLHPSQTEMMQARIDDALMARDTTGINVVDANGVMFSSTPSGAWLPSVIAGDTGIPLTQRAQSFFLIPGHPNELQGGKRPRITLSPTLITQNGKPYMAMSTPGGDNQDQALLQVFLNVALFGMNAQQAVEAPRFQTRHLVSSFDNHAMNPGELFLDERVSTDTFLAMQRKGHTVSRRSRWSSGSHPVLIRVLPNGVLEAGVDPYGYRVAQAW